MAAGGNPYQDDGYDFRGKSPKKETKNYQALNMRNPGATTLQDLQNKDRAGELLTTK